MSLESIRKWGLAVGLMVGVPALGCGSDSDPDDPIIFYDSAVMIPDGGSDAARADASSDASPTPDASSTDAAPMDAARDTSTMDTSTELDTSTADTGDTSLADTSTQPDANNTCPADCTGVMVGSTMVRACCSGGGDAGPASCGLNADDLKLASPTSPFTGCVPKEVAQASASAYCGEIWDQVEIQKKDNGGLDLKAGNIEVVYEGCCLPSGECGASMREPRDTSAGDAGADAGADGGTDGGVDLHLGCVAYTRVRAALTLPDGGGPATPTNQPFCNPANGEAVTEGTVPGVAKFVCGCGANVQPVAGAVPTCLANFPKEVCGRDEPDAATLATIPEYICGCGDASPAASALTCLRNVAANVCGTKAINGNSTELTKIPEYICGCGPTALDPGGPVACMSNVETNVCGKTNIPTKDAIATLPEFLCGCGNNKAYDVEQVRCLSYVDAALCGGKNVTEASDPTLTKVPEFMCGCGENIPFNAQPLPCLSNVVKTVCGGLDVTASTQPDLAKLPAFVCGCGNGNLYDSEPYACLSNVAPEVCGGLSITNGNSPWLNNIPTYRCGCTGASFQQVGCLANTQSNICGRLAVQINNNTCLVGIPEYVRGCGNNASPTSGNPTCLRNIQNLPGCLDTAVDKKNTDPTDDDCLIGVPEYQLGCGNGSNTGPAGCLPLAHAFWGCEQVTTSVANVREHICGCGEGVVQPASATYPCLSNVALTVCGAVPVTRSQEVTDVPNTVCGCGDGVVTGANCVRNVPAGVCGAVETCHQVSGERLQYYCAPGGFPQRRCQDNFGTNASGARGDGIPDTCPQ